MTGRASDCCSGYSEREEYCSGTGALHTYTACGFGLACRLLVSTLSHECTCQRYTVQVSWIPAKSCKAPADSREDCVLYRTAPSAMKGRRSSRLRSFQLYMMHWKASSPTSAWSSARPLYSLPRGMRSCLCTLATRYVQVHWCRVPRQRGQKRNRADGYRSVQPWLMVVRSLMG